MRRLYLLAGALPLYFLVACASSPLPPRLTSIERERLTELPLQYSVGVVPYQHPVYSDKLTESLRDAGIFSRVSPVSEFAGSPDLIATVEKSVYGTAVIPAATFATGGVIPTVVGEDHGFIFSLAPASQRTKKTFVDASYSGTTTLGWAALAVNASPNYTYADPEKTDRFRKMLSYRTLIALRPR